MKNLSPELQQRAEQLAYDFLERIETEDPGVQENACNHVGLLATLRFLKIMPMGLHPEGKQQLREIIERLERDRKGG